MNNCPDSYQNQEKDINIPKTTLFTGNQDTEMQVFFNECLYSAVLESGCSSTIEREDWLKNYLDSLNQEELAEVEKEESDTIFKSWWWEASYFKRKMDHTLYNSWC